MYQRVFEKIFSLFRFTLFKEPIKNQPGNTAYLPIDNRSRWIHLFPDIIFQDKD